VTDRVERLVENAAEAVDLELGAKVARYPEVDPGADALVDQDPGTPGVDLLGAQRGDDAGGVVPW
jgi:hypothetical protein